MIYFRVPCSITLIFFVIVCSSKDKTKNTDVSEENLSQAIVAGGCFWCTESDLENLSGVSYVISGYTGGIKKNPTYKEVSQGRTKYLESVQVFFDSTKVSYREILEYFFKTIDPTDTDGQFTDRGDHYTSAIFYIDSNQQNIAYAVKSELQKSKKFKKEIYTIIRPALKFYPAEKYHQNYYKTNPRHYQSYRYYSGRTSFIQKHWNNIYEEKSNH